ncbi:MAG: ABC transporter permease [Chloroflexota bacterium]|nr:ABC transporter permease [Chloroflexota bacterium]
MWTYVIRRLLLAIPTLLGVTVVVFGVMRVAPGDVAVLILGGDSGLVGTPEQLEALREKLGLNRPLYIQYFEWLWGLITFNWGESYFYNAEMTQLLSRKLPLSAQVGIMGLVGGSILGVIGGVIAALKQDSWADYVIRVIAILGISVPTFWSGMMLILVFVRFWGWIPEQGYVPLWEDPMRNLAQLIWPSIIIGLGFLMGVPLRMMRATMLEVMREDYIRTARSKGLKENIIIVRHAMRNAMIPVITLIGIFIPLTVTGLVVTEQVFGLPGIGRMMVDAINQRDYPVVQLVVTLTGFTVVVANLGVDLIYGWLDPRIRY